MTGGGVQRPKKRTRAFDMIEFLRPSSSWPWPYSLEQAFQVLQHALAAGAGVGEKACRGFSGVTETIYGEGSTNVPTCLEIRGEECLQRFYRNLLLSRANPTVERWRQENGFYAGGQARVAFKSYRPDLKRPFLGDKAASWAVVANALNDFLGNYEGHFLSVSLLSDFPQAGFVERNAVQVTECGFRFTTTISFGGARWCFVVAATEGDEAFTDTLARAIRTFEAILDHALPVAVRVARLRQLWPIALDTDSVSSSQVNRKNHWLLVDGQIIRVVQPEPTSGAMPRFFSVGTIGGKNGSFIVDGRSSQVVYQTSSADANNWPLLGEVANALNQIAPSSHTVCRAFVVSIFEGEQSVKIAA
jgi:hypothetical protein